MDEATILPFLRALAYESAQEILPYYYEPSLATQIKKDGSPVTIADQQTEKILRKRIKKKFPDHGIIGEEYDNERTHADYVWYLDPIDGTRSFIAGCPLFGTLIGLTFKGKPIWGVIHLPVLKQMIIGNNHKTLLNGEVVRVSKTDCLSKSLVLTTDYQNIDTYQNISLWNKFTKKVSMTRTWGDCYGYMTLASGRAEVMVDPILEPWDLMALIPIIQGAGGVITDYQGNPAHEGRSIIASNQYLHSEILKLLNQ